MIHAGDARVLEVIPRTRNVKSFRLEPLAGGGYCAGQFMCVRFKAGHEPKRWLSFSSSPTEKGYIEFTKKITHSDFSRALDRIAPGDLLNVQYPFGKFMLDTGDKKIAFLSGGIGITPIRSICKVVCDAGLDVDVKLVYANRSLRDIVFREDFDRMQEMNPRLKCAHVLCEAAPGFKCAVGLINGNIIKNEISDYHARRFFLCGPPSMVEAMRKVLTEDLAVSRERIVTENFTGY